MPFDPSQFFTPNGEYLYHKVEMTIIPADDLAQLRADLDAARQALIEVDYYYSCMTDEDRERLEDMMGDPFPIDEIRAALAPHQQVKND